MSGNWQLLQRDLTIFERMVGEFEAYLASEATHWTLAEADLPGLTIGGTLMRQQRLLAVSGELTPEARERFDSTAARLEGILSSNVVRFEVRTHQELRARVSEWVNYLRRFQRGHGVTPDSYERLVDTRVVIAAMISRLEKAPFQLDMNIEREVEILDRNLKRRWEPGAFIWDDVWRSAYDEATDWYLYGRLR